jgi:predicted lipoprotein with Yx(FWY)xxD motif
MYRRRPGLRGTIAVLATALAALACSAASAGAAGAATTTAASSSGGTVIAAVTGAFGPMLVVGSGPYKGYTLYFISSDNAPHHYGCGTKVMDILGSHFACTGPSNDTKAEWPAITTKGAPVAGPGVQASMLGVVDRKGVGHQVTYAGHPLYLFDSSPGEITGEGWDEPSLPPWHGVWWVMSPSGQPQPWPGMLTTTTIKSQRVLGELMQTGAGWIVFPAYTYSKDTSSASACNNACARAWPPVLTSGIPGLGSGLSASDLGTITRSDGTTQVTWNGQPLYFYSKEGLAPTATGFGATGSGNGLKRNGGTFRLVTT